MLESKLQSNFGGGGEPARCWTPARSTEHSHTHTHTARMRTPGQECTMNQVCLSHSLPLPWFSRLVLSFLILRWFSRWQRSAGGKAVYETSAAANYRTGQPRLLREEEKKTRGREQQMQDAGGGLRERAILGMYE
ncbi:hypothetical protein H105_08816 [Trichophyton soudanense CBS 452.61]|uniref:Uncharacterized protein n=1 Tax=Trichophyton soudanense CBS 452.61 TaxID=1215331 RepID=A0A022XDS6_TRISD|nr:hypothetical protein H105_08816 [Trichophyton soudanense CBS 452.61]